MRAPALRVRKRQRRRLARSEVILLLSVTAQRWANEVGDRDTRTRPFAEWGPGDPMTDLVARYGLSPADLAGILDELADGLEQRAMRCGYEDAWV